MRVWEMSKSENFSDLDLPVSALYASGAAAGGLLSVVRASSHARGNRISVRACSSKAPSPSSDRVNFSIVTARGERERARQHAFAIRRRRVPRDPCQNFASSTADAR